MFENPVAIVPAADAAGQSRGSISRAAFRRGRFRMTRVLDEDQPVHKWWEARGPLERPVRKASIGYRFVRRKHLDAQGALQPLGKLSVVPDDACLSLKQEVTLEPPYRVRGGDPLSVPLAVSQHSVAPAGEDAEHGSYHARVRRIEGRGLARPTLPKECDDPVSRLRLSQAEGSSITLSELQRRSVAPRRRPLRSAIYTDRDRARLWSEHGRQQARRPASHVQVTTQYVGILDQDSAEPGDILCSLQASSTNSCGLGARSTNVEATPDVNTGGVDDVCGDVQPFEEALSAHSLELSTGEADIARGAVWTRTDRTLAPLSRRPASGPRLDTVRPRSGLQVSEFESVGRQIAAQSWHEALEFVLKAREEGSIERLPSDREAGGPRAYRRSVGGPRRAVNSVAAMRWLDGIRKGVDDVWWLRIRDQVGHALFKGFRMANTEDQGMGQVTSRMHQLFRRVKVVSRDIRMTEREARKILNETVQYLVPPKVEEEKEPADMIPPPLFDVRVKRNVMRAGQEFVLPLELPKRAAPRLEGRGQVLLRGMEEARIRSSVRSFYTVGQLAGGPPRGSSVAVALGEGRT